MATIQSKKLRADEEEDVVNAEEEEDEDVVPAEEEDEEEMSVQDDTEDEEEEEEEDEEEDEPAEEVGEEGGEEDDEEKEEGETIKIKRTKRTVVSNIGSLDMLKTKPSKKIPIQTNYDEDDDEDEEEDDDDVNYLQKFDNKMRDNFILEHHPEARTHNYEEVKALTRVTRDGRGIIIDPLHKTIPFLTKYEMTRVIGQRAKQLDSGAKAFVKVPVNVISGYHIALLELEQKKLPFIIKRPFPNGGVEYWNVSDLEMLI